MLASAAFIWGSGFVVMKDSVDVLPPAYLLGFRFLAAGLILVVVFWKQVRKCLSKDYLLIGALLGVLNFVAFWVQTIGLTDTTPGKNAFITATYCVIVPFVYWLVARRKPTVFNLVAAVLCVAGIGFVSLQGSSSEGAEGLASIASLLSMSFGDFMTLICAFIFAVHITLVAKFSERYEVMPLTVYQFLVGGVCGLLIGAGTETLPPASIVTPDFLMGMAYLVVFASCVALGFQNVSLAHVHPAPAALLLSLESVFGVLFSVALYGEAITVRLLIGFVLIFAAIVVSEVLPLAWKKPTNKTVSNETP